jgi:glycosyltransferase involved in cell wall biosynthesis
MKITFILPNWVGNFAGGIQSNMSLASHLQKRGHEVCLISLKKRPASFKKQIRSLLKGKGWISSQKSNFSYLDGLDITGKIIDHQPPLTDADVPDADIVVATFWITAEWVSKLSPQKGAKVYMIRHHEVHSYLTKERSALTYRLPLHKVVICQWLLDIMKNEYGDHNVDFVPNSIELEKYYAPLRGKSSIPTVGLMYTNADWKGCDIALKAFNLASEKIPNLKLVAFGKNDPTLELPLPPNTNYVKQPPQNEIKNIYAQCDGWLFASRNEGFGRPILEAMACRTPVIGTPAGAAPELLAKGGGILVKPEDPEDMAKAIIKICQMSNDDWLSMSNAAYQTATGYTWDDAAQLFEQALYRAIERTKKGDL